MPERNIWDLGFQAANNPGVAKQFLHSATITSARRTLTKKAGLARLGVKVASKATSFIPVPYVGDVINKGMSIASTKIRSWAIKRKKGAADSTDPSLEKLVKFSVKDLDISDLDRYRRKVKEAQDDFQKAVANFGETMGKNMASDEVCKAFFDVAEKRGYLVRRLIKMQARTAAVVEIMRLTDKWCAEVTKSLNDWQRTNGGAWKAMLESYPESVHANCPADICVMRTGPGRGGTTKFGAAVCKLTSQAVSFLAVEDLVEYGVDQGIGQIPT